MKPAKALKASCPHQQYLFFPNILVDKECKRVCMKLSVYVNILHGEPLLVEKGKLFSPSTNLFLFPHYRVHVTQEQMNTTIFHLILAKK